MKLFKKKTFFTSLVLTCILCLSFLLPSLASINNDLATRNINVNEIGTLSYEEKAQQLLNTFDEYSILNDENNALYEKYRALTEQFGKFHLLGRLAEYKYYNIDAMCRKAMDLAEEIGWNYWLLQYLATIHRIIWNTVSIEFCRVAMMCTF